MKRERQTENRVTDTHAHRKRTKHTTFDSPCVPVVRVEMQHQFTGESKSTHESIAGARAWKPQDGGHVRRHYASTSLDRGNHLAHPQSMDELDGALEAVSCMVTGLCGTHTSQNIYTRHAPCHASIHTEPQASGEAQEGPVPTVIRHLAPVSRARASGHSPHTKCPAAPLVPQ
jgi:hypothetical protein